MVLNNPYIFRTVNTTFDFNTDYEDVKIGLINSNLLTFSQVSANKVADITCVVCQDEIQLNDVIRTISCNHMFHIDCIDKWFCENKKCPMCKFVLE